MKNIMMEYGGTCIGIIGGSLMMALASGVIRAESPLWRIVCFLGNGGC